MATEFCQTKIKKAPNLFTRFVAIRRYLETIIVSIYSSDLCGYSFV